MKVGWLGVVAGALLVAMTLAAYVPAMRAGFVWDDDQNVTGKAGLTSLADLWRIWTDPRATQQYYPLTHSVFWLQRRLWGLEPLGYHLVNILLHTGAVLLLWLVLMELGLSGSWPAAALFALHPLQTESVAWVTELKNVLSGCLFLASLLAYLRFAGVRAGPARAAGGRAAWGLSLALFALALLAKTAVSPLPAAIVALLWWKQGRPGPRDLAPLAPFFALGIGAGLVTAALERSHVGASGPEFAQSLAEKLVGAGKVFWFYPGKLLWPSGIAFVYPRWRADTGEWSSWIPAAAAPAAAALLWLARGRIGKAPLAALLWYGVMIFPALGFFNVYYMRYSPVQDHFQYAAGMGLIALVAATCNKWGQIYFSLPPVPDLKAKNISAPIFPRLAATVALLALGAMTWRQAAAYHDTETLWRASLARNPDGWLARNNLCQILAHRGDLVEAIRHGEEAVRLEPSYFEGHINLGIALAHSGRLDEAEARFTEALRLNPRSDDALVDLGNILSERGRPQEALARYQQALAINPNRPVTENNIGVQCVRLGRFEEALGHYLAALRFDPAYVDARFNLAWALETLGRKDEAVAEYREILRRVPGDARALEALTLLR